MKYNINFPSSYSVKDTFNDNIDIHIIVKEDVYFGTLFTIENINEIILKSVSEKYFWATNMLIVSDLEEVTIREVIGNLVESNYLEQIFEKIGTIDTVYGSPPVFGELW